MLISFNGSDGSGKSSQAFRLVDELKAAGYPAVYIWCGSRSPITRFVVRLARRVLKAPKKTAPADAPASTTNSARTDNREQGEAYLSSTERILNRPLVRTLWLHLSLVEHTVKIWFTVLPHLLRGRVVVSDRYLYDSVFSLAAMANVPPEKLPALLKQAAFYKVPRPDLWFFLDVPAEVAFQRKPDIPDVALVERRIPLYHAAAPVLGMEVIDAAKTPEEIAALIWQRVQSTLPQTTEASPTP